MDPLLDFDYYLLTTNGATELITAVGEELEAPLPGHGELQKIDFWQALIWDAENGGGHFPSEYAQELLQGLSELLEVRPPEG